ncbi:MAG: TRAP transporter TatT component family protein [Myxococcales bacterium]
MVAAGCASARRAAAPAGTATATPPATATPAAAASPAATPAATAKTAATATGVGKPTGSQRELIARAAAAWESKEEPGSLDEAIRLWEEAAAQPPVPVEALTSAARARRLRFERAGLASSDGLHETARDASACADDARRAWAAVEPDAAAGAAAGQPLGDVLAHVGARAAEPLYFEAVCTAAWARAQGFTPLIERRGELKQMLTRVAQLAPDLDEAGAERELGKLYSALPAYAGGDLREARAHFEAALARAPSSARTRIVFARTVGVKAQDRALFEAQLQAASAAEDRDLAEEAKEMLARESELFGPAEAAQPIPGGPTK